MILQQYLKENPAKTLTEVQECSETENFVFAASTMGLLIGMASPTLLNYMKEVRNCVHDTPVYLINPETATPYLNEYNQPVVDYFTAHPAKQSMEILFMSLEKTNGDGRDFNFVTSSRKGQIVIANITQLIDETMTERADDLRGLLAICLGEANKVVYPYANTTLAQYDEAKAKNALYAPTSPLKVGYPQLDSAVNYSVVLAGRPVKVAAILPLPAPVDVKIEVFFHTDYSETENFDVKGIKVGYLRIAKGETNGSFNVNKSLSRKIQASAISDISCDYNLIVKSL
jgi:hypothetical protein